MKTKKLKILYAEDFIDANPFAAHMKVKAGETVKTFGYEVENTLMQDVVLVMEL